MVTTTKRKSTPSPKSTTIKSTTKSKKKSTAVETTASQPSKLINAAKQLQSWTGTLLGSAGNAADLALSIAQMATKKPEQKAAVTKAASLLRDMRQAAGLTQADLSHALEIDDPSLMGLVESGKVALPFDLILRLASVLGRNDPVGFVMQMTRSYSPKTWKTLESLGLGKLLVQAGREREFANIYRSIDAARDLSDKDFATALGFAKTAFETAMAFQATQASKDIS